ncbi:uncharacterized protein LOC106804246 [Setaria italica]|uniref:uncharacterized protein LOC106804246 n=1 Tax=Setaria italica TaxID=4555 RepID=UPI0007199D9C|nr:uncharacterized protein LOC106804246 [Setaria italica]
MVVPLKKALGGYDHLLVVVDKFTKWIESKTIMSLKSEQAVEFMLDIVYQFGVPNCIITDNSSNFTWKKFLEFCDSYEKIRVDWASATHPRTNGQVERSNGMILQGLKPCIYDMLKKFTERLVAELPSMLWSLRTTPNRSTGFTPFFMTYGAKVVPPTELDYGSPKVHAYQEDGKTTSTC